MVEGKERTEIKDLITDLRKFFGRTESETPPLGGFALVDILICKKIYQLYVCD